MAAPSVTPEAIPSRFGRYSWPSTTVIAKVPTTAKPTTAISGNAGTIGAAMKAAMTGADEGQVHASRIVRLPTAVGDTAGDQRAGGAGGEHRRQRGVARRLRGAERRDEPDRHEREQAEVDAGAQRDHAGQPGERAPAVLLRLRAFLGGGSPRSRSRAEPRPFASSVAPAVAGTKATKRVPGRPKASTQRWSARGRARSRRCRRARTGSCPAPWRRPRRSWRDGRPPGGRRRPRCRTGRSRRR